jgi:hypothetical protein
MCGASVDSNTRTTAMDLPSKSNVPVTNGGSGSHSPCSTAASATAGRVERACRSRGACRHSRHPGGAILRVCSRTKLPRHRSSVARVAGASVPPGGPPGARSAPAAGPGRGRRVLADECSGAPCAEDGTGPFMRPCSPGTPGTARTQRSCSSVSLSSGRARRTCSSASIRGRTWSWK